MSNEQKRRFTNNTRTTILLILFISFMVIWYSQLYQFTISIAAIGAALAIATKEVILNFGGTFYRAFARPFSIGDRIEINEIRGDVVDIGLMSTQLIEIGPKDYTHQYTGRTIVVPNSMFLTKQISNETATAHEEGDFVLHVFEVPIKNDNSWNKHLDTIIDVANSVCEQYIESATIFFKRIVEKRKVNMPWVEPRVNLKFRSPSEMILIVRITVPVRLKGTLEQKIIREYLNKIH